VVLDDFNVMRSILLPHKADAELIVDADTVLASPLSLQRLQHVSRRLAEIVQAGSRVHAVELQTGYDFYTAPSPVCPQLSQFRSVAVFEAPYHVSIVGCDAFNVKP
jgi:hypothetical protein